MSALPPPLSPLPSQPAQSSTNKWVVPVIALLVGSGIGFAVGRATTSDKAGNADPTPVTTEAQAPPSASSETTSVPDSNGRPDTTSVPDIAPRESTASSDSSTVDPTTIAPGNVTPAAPDASAFVGSFGQAELVSLAPGEPGKVSVIESGPYVTGSQILPVLVRNMTGQTLGRITLTGVARDATGALVGSGEDQGLQPAVVAPGEVAWGDVYFGADLPQGTTFEVLASGEPLGDLSFSNLPMEITELNVSQDTIVGIASNAGTTTVSGPIGVSVLCLSQDGAELIVKSDYATSDSVAPGGTTAFTVNFFGDPVCERFLVAASGYSF